MTPPAGGGGPSKDIFVALHYLIVLPQRLDLLAHTLRV